MQCLTCLPAFMETAGDIHLPPAKPSDSSLHFSRHLFPVRLKQAWLEIRGDDMRLSGLLDQIWQKAAKTQTENVWRNMAFRVRRVFMKRLVHFRDDFRLNTRLQWNFIHLLWAIHWPQMPPLGFSLKIEHRDWQRMKSKTSIFFFQCVSVCWKYKLMNSRGSLRRKNDFHLHHRIIINSKRRESQKNNQFF